MGAWRCFGRLLASCSQLISQGSPTIATKTSGAGVLCRRQLLIRAFSSSSNPVQVVNPNVSRASDPLEKSSFAAAQTASKSSPPSGEVRRIRGSYKGTAKGKNVLREDWDAPPLPEDFVDSWRSKSIAQQAAHLRTVPMKSQWAFLERLEASAETPDIVLWNNALNAVQFNPRPVWTIEELERLVSRLWAKGYPPHVSLYVTLLNACCRRHEIARAVQIHDEMIARGLSPDRDTVYALAQTLGKGYRGQKRLTKADAWRVLDEIEAFVGRMSDTWRVAMDVETAKVLLKAVRVACEWSPLVASFASRSVPIVQQVTRQLRKQGLVLDDTVCALVLDLFAIDMKDLRRAHVLVDEMKRLGDEVGERVYSRMIQGYTLRGQFEEANALLSKVEREGVTFFSHGLGIVIDLFATQGQFAEAGRLFEQAESQGVVDPLIVLAHIRTCYLQGEIEEVVEVVKRHVSRFNWDPCWLGPPNPLVSKLLEALAHDPTWKNRDLIQQALKLCPSEVARLTCKLLQDKCPPQEKLPMRVFREYFSRDPYRAYENIERLIDCVWLLERRGRAVNLMQWATSNGMFVGAWLPSQPGRNVIIDLHGLTVGPGKAMVLLALKESVANPEALRNVSVITGRGDHREVSGVMLGKVRTLLEEYNLPYELMEGEGGVRIDKGDLRQWFSNLRL